MLIQPGDFIVSMKFFCTPVRYLCAETGIHFLNNLYVFIHLVYVVSF